MLLSRSSPAAVRGPLLALILALGAFPVPGSGAVPISGAPTGTAGFVGLAAQGPLDTPVLVTSAAGFDAVFGAGTAGLANPWLRPSVRAFFDNGGTRAYVVRVADDQDQSLIGPGAGEGLRALEGVDEVSVVAIPGAASASVQSALIAHCETAGDRMALLDPASDDDFDSVRVRRAGLASAQGHAALYFPWIETPASGSVPPSGFVAGVYARTDPPDSPVEFLTGASGVSVTLSSSQVDVLNPEGINPVREFSGQGVRIWGARTIAADPEWIYVAVRRTGLYLAESITEGTAWALEEPNDATLWSQLTADVENFLYTHWQQGWFTGTQPEDAFFVQCGLGLTMTGDDVDAGRTRLVYGFAPLRPAEFVIGEVVHDRGAVTSAPSGRRAVLHPASPNPFNPRTTIRFELPRTARVDLAVYDLAGRRVRGLVGGAHLEAGVHRRPWDGRDDHGRRLASGVYLVRLTGPGIEGSQPVTLLK